MKRFIANALGFAGLIVVLIGGVCAAEIVAEIRQYHEELKVPEGAAVLVCNDSQTAKGIDSAHFPEFFNYSAPGRMLDQAYLVMTDALRLNRGGSLRTVVFDVTPAAATGRLREPLREMGLPSTYWLLHCLHWHENIRPLDGVLFVVRDNLVGNRLKHFWRALRGKVAFRSSLAGQFLPLDQVCKETAPDVYWNRIRGKAQSSKGLRTLTLASPFVVDVLDRVVACARKNDVRLLFVTTPWTDDLREVCSPSEMDAFTALMRQFAESRRCEYVDFLRLRLDDSCWSDGNHLNSRGAETFTRMLRQTLVERKLL